MNNDSTTALNQLLESLELTAEEKTRNNWARRTKTTFLSYTLRVFENVITHKLMTVTYDAAKDCYYTRLLLDPLCASAGASIKQKLIDALKDVKHCGDYGELFFLANPPTAWVVMGDADGDENEGHTSFDTIKKLLKDTGLITHVEIEGECYPDMDDEADPKFTYADFGKFGTIV